jgi:hypothetical protein
MHKYSFCIQIKALVPKIFVATYDHTICLGPNTLEPSAGPAAVKT